VNTIIFFFFNMLVSIYTKKKQTIVLGRRIEDSTNIIKIKPCSIYMLSSRKYVFDQILSGRYSEYYRKQVSYNSLSDE
jgi:hypothetical protein